VEKAVLYLTINLTEHTGNKHYFTLLRSHTNTERKTATLK